MITFRKVKDKWGWFSNMSPHPIVYEGVTYHTAEHLFQCMRHTDPKIRAAIAAPKSPMSSKMTAKTYLDKAVVVPRSQQDLMNMMGVLRLKIDQYPELRAELLSTGDEEIVEDVTARPNESGLFWGKALNGYGYWTGQNHLGLLWMLVRLSIRFEDLYTKPK